MLAHVLALAVFLLIRTELFAAMPALPVLETPPQDNAILNPELQSFTAIDRVQRAVFGLTTFIAEGGFRAVLAILEHDISAFSELLSAYRVIKPITTHFYTDIDRSFLPTNTIDPAATAATGRYVVGRDRPPMFVARAPDTAEPNGAVDSVRLVQLDSNAMRLVAQADIRSKSSPASEKASALNILELGAIGDGKSHPLSERFSTLAEAQRLYPHVTTLTDEFDWAVLQGAMNVMRDGDMLIVPRGLYRINRTLLLKAKQGINVMGYGSRNGSQLMWVGDTSSPLLHIYGTRDSVFSNFSIISSATHPLFAAIQLETLAGKTMTANQFHNIVIQGITPGLGVTRGIRTVAGTGGDNNNDFHLFVKVHVDNYNEAAWSFEHSQSKGHVLLDCAWAGNGKGQRGVATALGPTKRGGSFACYKCAGGGNTIADFDIGEANDYVQVWGGNFEDSARLLKTFEAGGGGSGAPFTVLIAGVRWSIQGLAGDNRAIIFKFRGPLVMLNNLFEPAFMARPLEIYWEPGANVGQFIAIGNHIASTLPNPFTGTKQPTISLGNLIDRHDGRDPVSLDDLRVNGSMTIGGNLTLQSRTFADLDSPADGTLVYCLDCTIARRCTAGGAGALAKRIAGQWICN